MMDKRPHNGWLSLPRQNAPPFEICSMMMDGSVIGPKSRYSSELQTRKFWMR